MTLSSFIPAINVIPIIHPIRMSSISQTKSLFADAEPIPRDSIFEVTRRLNADPSPDKINLGQGTYRDENGQPWILPSVRMAEESLGETGHEYLPIAGFKPLRDEAVKLVFEGTKAFKENRVRMSRSLVRPSV